MDKEFHPRLTGHGLGKQSLAGTGRAHQQSALGQSCADGRVLLGVVEEVDDLLQGLLGLVLTGHVLEGDAGLLFHIHLGVGLAHVADAADAAAVFGHDPHHQHDQPHGQQHRQNVHHQDVAQDAPGALDGAGILHVVLIQQGKQPGVRQVGGVQGDGILLALGIGPGLLVLVGRLLGIGIAVHVGGIAARGRIDVVLHLFNLFTGTGPAGRINQNSLDRVRTVPKGVDSGVSDAVDGLAPRFVVLLVSVFGWACNFFLHAGAQAVVVLFLCATFDQLAKGRSCHARDFVYRYGSRSTADKWCSPGCFGLQVIVAVVAVREDEIGAVIVKSFSDGRFSPS